MLEVRAGRSTLFLRSWLLEKPNDHGAQFGTSRRDESPSLPRIEVT
jgi:hypothetical protein